ncbi:serine hydrolase-like protein, partial [Dinothrombium tinctorium]
WTFVKYFHTFLLIHLFLLQEFANYLKSFFVNLKNMPKEWKEIEFSVPYGSIRGKAWGDASDDEKCLKFLALHGWQDNAGTYDEVIPLLNFDCYVLAIDLPGHGLSSHLPAGVPYTDYQYTIEIRKIVDHLGWKKYSFMGHSMGGMIALFFASFYPDEVQMVVCLDVLKPLTCDANSIAENVAKNVNTFTNIETKLKPSIRAYTYQEAINRMMEAHSIFGNITEKGARALLRRGAKQIDGDKFVFTRDIRLRSLVFTRYTGDCLKAFFSRFKCDILILMAKSGVKHDNEDVKNEFLDVYAKCAKYFKYIEVDGEHHIHLYDAKAIVPHINEFVSRLNFSDGLKNGHH